MSDYTWTPRRLFGYVEFVETMRVEGDDLVLGGYWRHFDRHGRLLHESEPADTLILEGGAHLRQPRAERA
ncbi:MAG TPA: hypothetical protein VHP37_33710 [Burkholderiales bacterium]|nr:hypothetical protein [Burkholderiales bacterium]